MVILTVHATAGLFAEGSDRWLGERLLSAVGRVLEPNDESVLYLFPRVDSFRVRNAAGDESAYVRTEIWVRSGQAGPSHRGRLASELRAIVAEFLAVPDIPIPMTVHFEETSATGWGPPLDRTN